MYAAEARQCTAAGHPASVIVLLTLVLISSAVEAGVIPINGTIAGSESGAPFPNPAEGIYVNGNPYVAGGQVTRQMPNRRLVLTSAGLKAQSAEKGFIDALLAIRNDDNRNDQLAVYVAPAYYVNADFCVTKWKIRVELFGSSCELLTGANEKSHDKVDR